jgi:hypothetical protein
MPQLLDPERDDAWARHAAGAASLIRLRGPQGFETELEKDLFMSHLGPIVSLAFPLGPRLLRHLLDHPSNTQQPNLLPGATGMETSPTLYDYE